MASVGDARVDDENGDLVVVALGGVQRFIAESRTTADLASASRIVAALAQAAATACGEHAALVFPREVVGTEPDAAGRTDRTVRRVSDSAGEPVRTTPGAPNRVVAIAPEGAGEQAARAAAAAVHDRWAELLRRTYEPDPPPGDGTPGMPDIAWVSIPASAGDYAMRWRLAQRALAARRRVRNFAPVTERGRRLCGQSPRWPEARVPAKARKHDRDERLAAANWVKRRYRTFTTGEDAGENAGFASTYSIASAPYRRALLDRLGAEPVREAVTGLRGAVLAVTRQRETPVPGLTWPKGDELAAWVATSAGPWLYETRWSPRALVREYGDELKKRHGLDERSLPRTCAELAERGVAALRTLLAAVDPQVRRPPTAYLAVLAQDLDDMGAYLSGEMPGGRGQARIAVRADVHRDVSGRLKALADAQVRALSGGDTPAVPIYAGGDDLLAFAPAAMALAAGRAVHDLVLDADLRTASTAVVFFHVQGSLRRAVGTAQGLLDRAKERLGDKHGLAVAYLRRSGMRAESIQPWTPSEGAAVIELFELLRDDQEHRLSPRLVSDLDRDEDEFALLARTAGLEEFFEAEVRRLVDRHTGGPHTRRRTEQVGRTARALVDLGWRERSVSRASGGHPSSFPVPAARVGVFLRQEAQAPSWPVAADRGDAAGAARDGGR